MPDFRVTIDVKNVARGDIVTLCESLIANYGEDFDSARGEFAIRTAKREGQSGENYFSFDWQEDED